MAQQLFSLALEAMTQFLLNTQPQGPRPCGRAPCKGGGIFWVTMCCTCMCMAPMGPPGLRGTGGGGAFQAHVFRHVFSRAQSKQTEMTCKKYRFCTFSLSAELYTEGAELIREVSAATELSLSMLGTNIQAGVLRLLGIGTSTICGEGPGMGSLGPGQQPTARTTAHELLGTLKGSHASRGLVYSAA